MTTDSNGPSGNGHDRPGLFARIRYLPLAGRIADRGMGSHAVSKNTRQAGSRIAGEGRVATARR